jgi:hypothetical protein
MAEREFHVNLRERLPFILAVAITVAWVAFIGVYLYKLGWWVVMALPPTQLATLLAAAGGPLAALWLLVAVLEQRRDTNELVRRLAQSVHQAEAQTRALMQLQNQSTRAQSVEARTLALHDLASNAAVLAERLGVLTRDNLNAAWVRYGSGDVTVFVQSFLGFAVTHPEITERMAEAVVRDGAARAALATFVRRYEQLTAAPIDDKMVREILEEGPLGRAYRLFKTADGLANGSGDPQGQLSALSQRLEAAAPAP